MPVFYDQMNRAVTLHQRPKRIISIVPSQTELLFDLGLSEQIVGITKYCIHPADQISQVTKIGGTKQLDIAKIHSLRPDLIIANKEENEQTQVEALIKDYPVWMSDINDLPTAVEMITKVGELTSATVKATEIAALITSRFQSVEPLLSKPRTAYLIWRKPYMAAGKGTFINYMLQLCGFNNVITQARYPEVTTEQLKAIAPDVLLLSSEPYPFAQKHIDELVAILPNTQILLVDGELFTWYGSRLLQSPRYFNDLISKLTGL
jgi:ABC-type Fe3+-hydroxamate transport system substrate-binding protein